MLIILGCLPLLWSALRHFDGMQWFGVLLLPFIIRPDKAQKGGTLYLWLGLFFTTLYLTLGQYYWTFAAGLSFIYHLLDSRVGKLNAVAPYTILFYLPLTRSFFTLFGFYIRMEITKWAGWLLSFFNDSVSYQDSSIWVDGNAFAVDPGCMGLRLVITGFIFSLLMVQQLSSRVGVKPSRRLVSMSLILSFLLVIVANFFRILLVIQFQSPAESWSHELIGLGTFLMVHIIPMFMMVKWLVSKKQKAQRPVPRMVKSSSVDQWVMIIAIGLMMFRWIAAPNAARFSGDEGLVKQIDGYELSVSRDGVHRYANANSVLLVKPMFPLSFSNHHPMLCWRGDGYEVVGEVRGKLSDIECYRAMLEKHGQQLVTSWWFASNDGARTTNEWQWRWKALTQNKQYFLVNFAATNESELLFTANQLQSGQVALMKPND